jgi:hypothetical protein
MTLPLLGFLCLASATLVVILGLRLTFFNDDWYLLLQLPGLASHGGFDALLEPHNANMVVLLVLVYKVLTVIFGMHSQLPFRLLLGTEMAALGILVYLLVSERVGALLGLAAAAVMLFLGPAWEVLLFFAAINHLAALTFGLAALLALESDSRRRNAFACALLICAVAISNTGLPFVVGAAIAVAIRRRRSQLWIPAIPAAVFVLWWAFYGHKQSSGVTAAHLAHLPRYVLDSLSSGLASISGLVHPGLPGILSSGHLLTVIALVAFVTWLARGGRPGPWALVFAGTALAFWLLTGASAIPGRAASASRYQLTDGALVILLGAELVRGSRPGRVLGVAVAALALLVVASNLDVLARGYGFMRAEARTTEADLGALEFAGPRTPANFRLLALVAQDPYLSGVTAGRYFAQTKAYGKPAFDSPAQLVSAPVPQRHDADSVLISAYGLGPQRISQRVSAAGCPRLGPRTRQVVPSMVVLPGSTVIKNLSGAPLAVGLSRFAPVAVPRYVDFLAGAAAIRLAIPHDSLGLPWRLSILNLRQAPGVRVAVCGR